MRLKLYVPMFTLALGLAVGYGCGDDDDDNGGGTDAAAGASGGAGGRTGGSGGSSAGGSGGRAGAGGSGGSSAGGSGGSSAGGSGGSSAGGSGGSSAGGSGGSAGAGGAGGRAGSGGSGGSGGSAGAGGAGGGNADAGADARADTGMSAYVWPTTEMTCLSNGMPTRAGVSAMDFCTYYSSKCMFKEGATSFANMGACVTRYNSYNDTQKGCASYHLCVAGTSMQNMTDHCPHPAQAAGPCALPAR